MSSTQHDVLRAKEAVIESNNNSDKLTINNSSTGNGIEVNQTGVGIGLEVNNSGSHIATFISQNANLATSSRGALSVYSNTALTTGAGLVIMNNAHASSTIPTLSISHGADVEVIDFDGCSDGGTSRTTIAGSLKIQMPNGSTGYINFYNAP